MSHANEWRFDMCHFEPKPLIETLGSGIGSNHRECDGKCPSSALLDHVLDDRSPKA